MGGRYTPSIQRTEVAVRSQLPLETHRSSERTSEYIRPVRTNKKERLENCALPVSPGWDRKVESEMVESVTGGIADGVGRASILRAEFSRCRFAPC